jgi:hypothetical protein
MPMDVADDSGTQQLLVMSATRGPNSCKPDGLAMTTRLLR